jgi:hypothetical protein
MDSSVNIAPNRSKSHDGFAPNIQETLIQRFEKSYKISIVPHALVEFGSLRQTQRIAAHSTEWLKCSGTLIIGKSPKY